MKLSDSVRYIKKIGEKKAILLSRLGISTVSDLLWHLPRTYEDRTAFKNICDLLDGETVCIKGHLIQGIRSFKGARGIKISQSAFSDGTGILKVTWFNSLYISNVLKQDTEYVLFGKVTFRANHFEMVNPVLETDDKGVKTGKILPVYPLCAGLTQNSIREAVSNAFLSLCEMPKDILPKTILEKYNYPDIETALFNIHFPKTEEAFLLAKERLSFEEMLVIQTGILKTKALRKSYVSKEIKNTKCIKEFADSLPFELTGAQKKVINEICKDLRKNVPMNRLVQGDVGSGKTLVAAAAAFAAIKSGYQCALMAPTEILANQHFKTFSKVFLPFGINIALLTGADSKSKREKILNEIKEGNVNLVIGTHALISEGVQFSNLALAITDEQHRFGVRQRASLNEKGKNVHTLVMTATPIPRTLSLILYGDLDISIIDELPPGRKPIKTFSASEKLRGRVLEFLKKEILNGRQIYIVCPLVEESETLTANSVNEYAKNLMKVFPEFEIGVLHGRLKQKEKDEIMESFVSGKINILVSTTVIEVGVDVANASVMVIENAERFGLSQLHQLRGRVGRGKDESYCILFLQTDGEIAKERVKVLCETSDGFKIAEHDLMLRGPGEFFGVRQHGLPELKISNLTTDMNLLKTAQDTAIALIEDDPKLEKEENILLKNIVIKKFNENGGKDFLN